MGEFSIHDFIYAFSTWLIAITAIMGTIVAIIGIFPIERYQKNIQLLKKYICDMFALCTANEREEEYFEALVKLRSLFFSYDKTYSDNERIVLKMDLIKTYVPILLNGILCLIVGTEFLLIISLNLFLYSSSEDAFLWARICSLTFVLFSAYIFWKCKHTYLIRLQEYLLPPELGIRFPSLHQLNQPDFKLEWSKIQLSMDVKSTVLPINLSQWLLAKQTFFSIYNMAIDYNKYSTYFKLKHLKYEDSIVFEFSLPKIYWNDETLEFAILKREKDSGNLIQIEFEILSTDKDDIKLYDDNYIIPIIDNVDSNCVKEIRFSYKDSQVNYIYYKKYDQRFTCGSFSEAYSEFSTIPNMKIFTKKK